MQQAVHGPAADRGQYAIYIATQICLDQLLSDVGGRLIVCLDVVKERQRQRLALLAVVQYVVKFIVQIKQGVFLLSDEETVWRPNIDFALSYHPESACASRVISLKYASCTPLE